MLVSISISRFEDLKFVKIKNDTSYRFVIFIAYYRCFRMLKLSRNK